MIISAPLSPLRVLNLTFSVLGRNGLRLALCTAVVYLLPTIVIGHLVIDPVIDDRGQATDVGFGYWCRFAIYYLTFFIFSGYLSAVAGRLIVNSLRGDNEPIRLLLAGSFRRQMRVLWLCLPLQIITYILIEVFYPAALPLIFVFTFFTPAIILEGFTLKAAWHQFWAITKGRWLALLANFSLCALCEWVVVAGNRATFDWLLVSMPFSMAGDINAVPWALISIFLDVWFTVLYAQARDQAGNPTDKVANVFE